MNNLRKQQGFFSFLACLYSFVSDFSTPFIVFMCDVPLSGKFYCELHSEELELDNGAEITFCEVGH